HRRRRIDVLFLRQPGKRGSLVADFVDELERDALPAGKDATVGHALQRRVVEVAARLHHAAKPGIGVRDVSIDGRERLTEGRSVRYLYCQTLTPCICRRAVTFGYLNSTPIEPTREVSSATM